MAYDEFLGKRIANLLTRMSVDYIEKRMFGGLCFMINGKMGCGIVKTDLMVRVIDSKFEENLNKEFVRKMDFTGKPLKGFIYVCPEGFETDEALENWLNLGVEFVYHK